MLTPHTSCSCPPPLQIGAILVCINPASVQNELVAALNLTECSTLFISPTIKNKDLIPMLHSILPSLRTTPAGQSLQDPSCPNLRRVFMVDNTPLGAQAYADMLASEGLEGRDSRHAWQWTGQGVPGAQKCTNDEGQFRSLLAGEIGCIRRLTLNTGPDFHTVCNFQFTSGTTGLPKA